MITDKLGREISIGSYIVYPSVGTIGEVLDMKTDDEGISWVLIQVDDLTKLWYNTQYVELTEHEKVNKSSSEDESKLSVEELKEKVNNHISAEMQDDGVGGG
ncbi:MAG: DUF2098 domain-containing protein [Methanosphaera sp.]|nr:DUF2098 domain-containing protein [Methanosphaera sp.]